MPEPILRFFRYEHLPAHLQAQSLPFHQLAHLLVATLPRNPERTVALRKLLEAKDAAVRAALPELTEEPPLPSNVETDSCGRAYVPWPKEPA